MKMTPEQTKLIIDQIQGTWQVTGLGLARPIDLIGDVKHIAGSAGYNEALGTDWGWFAIEAVGVHTLVLNYDDERNSATLRKVIDVVELDESGWHGRLYLCGLEQFSFTLTRQEASDGDAQEAKP